MFKWTKDNLAKRNTCNGCTIKAFGIISQYQEVTQISALLLNFTVNEYYEIATIPRVLTTKWFYTSSVSFGLFLTFYKSEVTYGEKLYRDS